MFSELTIGFDSWYMYRSCICLRHLRQNTASGSNVQGIVPRMIILWESLREKWFCGKTILVKPITDRRDKVDVRANRCLHQWATKQSLYQMMSHTTASPKYTLALTKIVLKIYHFILGLIYYLTLCVSSWAPQEVDWGASCWQRNVVIVVD